MADSVPFSSMGLGYRYDTVPNPPAIAATVATGMIMPPAIQAPRAATPAVASAAAPQDQPAAPSRPLGLKVETVKLRPLAWPAQAAPLPANAVAPAAAPAPPARTLVRVEGIAFDKIPEVTYGVYVSVPEGQEPSEASRDHLVGVLNFFGKDSQHARVRAARPGGHAGGHAAPAAGDGGVFSQTFDATKVVARLRGRGLYRDGDELRVDLRPLVPEAPRGAEATAAQRVAAATQQANVRYQDVKLLILP